MAGKFSIDAVFKATDRISAPIRRMQDRVHRFTERTKRGLKDIERVSDGVTNGFKRVGAAASAAAAVFSLAMADVIRTGAAFEQTMMRAVAKFPGQIQRGTEEFERLRQAAEDVGATTEFDAQQAAGALEVYAAAGFSAEQAIASLAGAGDLATVAGLSLDQAASTAADALSALGLASQDAAVQARNLTRVNDVLARTSSMVNTSVTEMAEAIKVGGNITVQSGQSVETFGALVAAMAQSNIRGAEAGTAIRNVLLRLQAPANRGAQALRKLRVSVRDSEGNMRDIVDVIGEMSRAMDGMGTAQRSRILSDIFGAETIGPALALLNAGSDGLAAFRDSLNSAEGAASSMAATMRDTTMGDIDGLTSAIDGVKTAIFGVISGPLRQLLQDLTEWVNRNRDVVTSGVREFLEWFIESLPEIAKWGRRIGTIAAVFLSVAAAVKVATAAMAIFNFVSALNPWVLLAVAIVAALALIIAFWPEISQFFSDMWEGVKILAERVASAMGQFIDRVWTPIKEFLVGAFEFVVGALRILLWPAMQLLRPLIDQIAFGADLIREHWGPISEFFSTLWSGIVAVVGEKWDSMKERWRLEYEAFVFLWDKLKSFFGAMWDFIVEDFKRKFGPIVEGITWVVDQVRGVGRATIEDVAGGGGGVGGSRPSPQIIGPQERAASTIAETTTTTRGEVTIRDETGRAEVTRRPRGPIGLTLEPTGAF